LPTTAPSSSATSPRWAGSRLDRNRDGRIDAQDPGWERLSIWEYDRDESGDPILGDPALGGTLTPIGETGIVSIGLASAITNLADGQGNTQTRLGAFTRADGSTSALGEYRFARDLADTEPAERLALPVDLHSLPDLHGHGNMHDLGQTRIQGETLL